MIKCDVRNCRLVSIGHSMETEEFVRASRVLAHRAQMIRACRLSVMVNTRVGLANRRLAIVDGKSGFLFCQMHAIFEQFTTVKFWNSSTTNRAREGAINAARVFRGAMTVDAERSRK